jgi:Flp pilus assembly pilin Flp
MLKKLTSEFKRFLADERGAEGLEKILLIGALILPLLGILIYFKSEITDWVKGIWGEVREDNQTYEYEG